MGHMSSTPEPTQTLAPLTRDRVTAALDARGMSYGFDEDGDVGGLWDGHLFYFFVNGDDDTVYLQVRGRWNRAVDRSEEDALVRTVNAWNTETIWPKAYVRVEDGVVNVHTEHTVDYSAGVSDAQVDLHLGCGVSTSLQLFRRLDQQYPEQAAAAKAETERLRAQR